jgi:hypothetical protein
LKAEQRQYPRYHTPEVDFQVFSRDAKILGKLVNISKGGLAFRFTPKPGVTAECRIIDITASDPEPFHLPGIACRRVYDISVLAEDESFRGTRTRLRGVQFIDLTEESTQKLTSLIDRFGVRLRTIP